MRFTTETPLVFLDTETTGMHNQHNRIIEIAAIRIENGIEVARMDTLLNPDTRIPDFITAITGIASDDVYDAPRFEEIAAELQTLFDGAVLVAHNARFDHAFLKSEFQRAGLPLRVPTLCTVRLSRKLFPEQNRHRLDELAAAAGVTFARRHRALDDTLALVAWWHHAHLKHGPEHVHAVANKLMATPSLPALVNDDVLKQLPNSPGVYLFYGEGNELLYVGKSIKIRDRVRSHFSQDYLTSKELTLTSRIERIEHEDTAGELGALLRESQLVKERMPTYNQQLRNTTSLVALVKTPDASGYDRLTLKRVTRLEPEHADRMIGYARTLRSAREQLEVLVKTNMLCQSLTSATKLTGSPCFAQTLGWCRGACIGTELPETYNERVTAVCESIGMRKWPYDGPITITEHHPSRRFSDEFDIEHWAVVERRRIDHADGSIELEEVEPRLDLDAYKIIAKALRNPLTHHIQ